MGERGLDRGHRLGMGSEGDGGGGSSDRCYQPIGELPTYINNKRVLHLFLPRMF